MSVLLACVLAVAALARMRPVAAQQRFQTLGPDGCINCHDHQEDRQWWEKKESPEVRRLFPNKGANAGHINSLKQLDEKKGDPWAAAIGLKDKYDPRGACVRCHGTVFKGDANAGVSCESCHGPGSGYEKPHQTKGAYQQAVSLGMTNLVGNVPGWVQQCTSCHVMDDAKLVAAGHPSGDDFDLGTRFQPVSLHFKKKYNGAEIAAIARPLVQALQRRRGGAVTAPPPPVQTPPVQTPQPPAARSIQPQPPPVQTPPPVQAQPPVQTQPYVQTPPPVQTQPQTTPPPATDPRQPQPQYSNPASPNPGVPSQESQVAVADPPADSIAPMTPARPAGPTGPLTPAVNGALQSASSLLALLQGRLIGALADALQQNAAVPMPLKARTPLATRHTGPDAALLQLQADAIALALEALGTAPVQPAPAQSRR